MHYYYKHVTNYKYNYKYNLVNLVNIEIEQVIKKEALPLVIVPCIGMPWPYSNHLVNETKGDRNPKLIPKL